MRRISQIHLGQPLDKPANEPKTPATKPRKILREFSKLSVVETGGFNMTDKTFEEKLKANHLGKSPTFQKPKPGELIN